MHLMTCNVVNEIVIFGKKLMWFNIMYQFLLMEKYIIQLTLYE